MFFHKFYPKQEYKITKSNGTTNEFHISEEIRLIAIENFGFLNCEVFLRDSPSQSRSQDKPKAQPLVIASLERSLNEHKDVWKELSKY